MSAGDQVGGLDPGVPSPDAIHAQIERLLASATFKNADRLSRFLRYIAEQTARGASKDIKEYAIGVEVFERGSGFDPRSDSVVRVEARRLRSKLRDYYDLEGAGDPIVVSMPKGSYIPTFEVVPPTPAVRKRRRFSRRMRIGLTAVGLLAGVGTAWLYGFRWNPVGTPIVAILPLENLSADASNEYFCHAISDQLASDLARDGRIRVITRNSSGPFDARADLAKAARELHAGFVIEGSASFSDDHVRVTVMVVELRGFTNVRLETYDRSLRDPLGVEAELATTIAGSIRRNLKW